MTTLNNPKKTYIGHVQEAFDTLGLGVPGSDEWQKNSAMVELPNTFVATLIGAARAALDAGLAPQIDYTTFQAHTVSTLGEAISNAEYQAKKALRNKDIRHPGKTLATAQWTFTNRLSGPDLKSIMGESTVPNLWLAQVLGAAKLYADRLKDEGERKHMRDAITYVIEHADKSRRTQAILKARSEPGSQEQAPPDLDTLAWELAGAVAVDAGQIWIGDPCYLIPRTRGSDDNKPPFDWEQYMEWTFEGYEGESDTPSSMVTRSYQQFNFPNGDPKTGHPGLGIAMRSGFGDGYYNVYVKRADIPGWGNCIVEARVVFIDKESLTNEDEEDDGPDDTGTK